MFDAPGHRAFEQVPARAGVVAVIFERICHGFRHHRVRGEVHDGVDTVFRDQTGDQVTVTGVADHQLAVQHGRAKTGTEVVQGHDAFGVLTQLADDVAAYIAGTAPINPYGTSKLMTEWMLRDLSAAADFRYVSLRYFNVAGCEPTGTIGQSTPKATLLVKVACEAAMGRRPGVSIFGTDYPTPDGTGLRDYIHVEDLATAHLDALTYLREGGESQVLNCGYGHGYSVRDVLAAVEAANEAPLEITEEPRRAGDPPELVAVADRVREVLGWQPRFDDLDLIVRTSLAWERKIAAQDPTAYWAA